MKLRNLLLAGAFALASLAGMGAAQPAAAQNFVYANPLARNHVQFGVVADEWIAEIQRATDNRVRIRHVPGGALLRLENMIEGLTSGVADLGVTNVASSARQLPITSILAGTADITLGNQLDTVGLATVFSRMLPEFPQISKEFADIGLVPMVWIPPFTFAVISRQPIARLADLQGKKIRVFGPNLPRIFSSIGATPLAVAAGEIYTSLQTGVIDGAYTTPAAMFSLRWFEQGRHIMFLGPRYGAHFMGIGDVYIMNVNSWNRISQADREIIQRVNRDFTVAAGRRMQQDGEDSIAEMRQRGITFTNLSAADTAELARRTGDFSAAAEQAINALGQPGTAIVARYRQLVAEYAAGRLR